MVSSCALVSTATFAYDSYSNFRLPELMACALSLACMVAIVGVLIYEDGKSLTQW
jgi:hypothetical protein